MSTVAARIQYSIGAKDQTGAAFDGVLRKMGAIDAVMAKVGRAAGLIGGSAAIAALGGQLKSAIDRMDEVGKASQRMGIGVENLSRLGYAAELSDVSLDELGTSVNKLNKNLSEIGSGKTGDAGRALSAIGVSAFDASGKLKSADQVIVDVANKFQTFDDGANKSALAMAIFGKSGADMIPLLNGGGAAISAATAEADRFGVTLTGDAARAAEVFNDNLTRMELAGQGLSNQILVGILPALNDMSEQFVSTVDTGELAKSMINGISWVLRETTKFTAEVSAAWQEMIIWVNAGSSSFDALTSGDFSAAGEAWMKAGRDVEAVWADVEKRFASVGQTISGAGKADLFETPAKKLAPSFLASTPSKKASPEIAEKFLAPKEDPLKAAAARMYEATRTPMEEYQARLNEIAAAEAKGYLTTETANRARDQASTSYFDAAVAMKDYSDDVASSMDVMANWAGVLETKMGGWLDDMVAGTFKLKDAIVDLGVSLAKSGIEMFFSSMAQSQSPVQGGGSLLGDIFGGIFGFAGGGMVKGKGTGTSDSNLAWLSDGEFVNNAASTKKYGPLLEAINNDSLPAFSGGGSVGGGLGAFPAIGDRNGGGAKVKVTNNVYNSANGTTARSEVTQNGNDINIKTFIEEAAVGAVTGQKGQGAMAATYGARPKKVRR